MTAGVLEDGRMKVRTALALVVMLLVGTMAGYAQQQTGEIFGKAADSSGAVLPGATVTVAGPTLLSPRTAVTSEAGTYRIPAVPIGTYSLTLEPPGCKTASIKDIRVTTCV